MNRTFALLVASAVMLAHMLAIHKDAADAIAPPYEVHPCPWMADPRTI